MDIFPIQYKQGYIIYNNIELSYGYQSCYRTKFKHVFRAHGIFFLTQPINSTTINVLCEGATTVAA